MHTFRSVAVFAALATLAACSGGNLNGGNGIPPEVRPTTAPGSVGLLKTVTTIGSTVDLGTGAGAGDQNPYGLAIAPVTAGVETAGDLIVCNFSDAAGVNGNGTTVEDLNPAPGSKPVRIIQSPALQGCNALAMAPNGNIWAADYTANNNPIISPKGTINTTLANNTWYGPWGQAFNGGTNAMPTFFETNANNGTVTRIHINPGPSFTFDTILSGLTYSGVPGSLLAPAGLTYDKGTDTLYVVDSNANRVIRINGATTAPAGQYAATGSTFNTSAVSTVYSGAPLASPISMALLGNGDLVIGNTAAATYGNNLMVEVNPTTNKLVGFTNVDSGNAGAIFGIAATVVNGSQYVYFNDDNDNTVKRLSP